MRAFLLDPTKIIPKTYWECPSCHQTNITQEARPHVPMHPCPVLKITAPFVQLLPGETYLAESRVRHVKKEREDYEGDEITQKDTDGRPVMAIVTERADGSNDCHAFAGLATSKKEDRNG